MPKLKVDSSADDAGKRDVSLRPSAAKLTHGRKASHSCPELQMQRQYAYLCSLLCQRGFAEKGVHYFHSTALLRLHN